MFHRLRVLHFFEALIIVASIPLGTTEVQSFGLKLLAITAVIHFLVLLLRDYRRLKSGWKKALVYSCIVIASLLAIVGSVQNRLNDLSSTNRRPLIVTRPLF